MAVSRALSRRGFLAFTPAAGLAAVAGLGSVARGALAQPGAAPEAGSTFSPITPEPEVRAVVGASHSDLDRVRAMVTERPALANATVDWGFGDFETAIGAASHVGRPDIARFLIEHGARPDIFTFAMLGNLEAVRAIVAAEPAVVRVKGPHGFTLAHHARVGGDAAAPVAAYLAGIEGADEQAISVPVETPADVVGEYELRSGGVGRFRVAEGNRGMQFQMDSYSNRNMIHLGGLRFHPVGTPAVVLQFAPAAGGATSVSIALGHRTIEAVRLA